ncbi:nickel/cobalt efflux system [Longispora fulva]|uniref:Nickel/cobalt efflux system n=1 Tax=Longispora fulva TaxID=619741 RepID=A0A8J7GHK4_9ACTN|nr:HoxN/HupN/NixA family nickel/cobalt transporter [Longispora fulva]MBG6136418.1 high-affinity nickel-transport protein [Longispora fulva]GIG59586.1 nickel/cobalt efflux system [Longispora fulva]
MSSAQHALRPSHRFLTRPDRYRLAGMFGFVVVLHALGWGVLLWLVVPGHYQLGAGLFGVGTGLTAYSLGLRHAFDVDHIAAIDNTTRKLVADGQRPLSVGFWFSLGHSTVVVALTTLIAFGVRAVGSGLSDDTSALRVYGGMIGTTVSGLFLYLIAAMNLLVLLGVVRIFRRMRRGEFDEAALSTHLDNRGFLNRLLGRLMRSVRRPWHIYPIGVLFGLGFDTVTEVSLLIIAGTSVAAGLPWYAIMCLPVLFAAGMSLLDTLDGSFMHAAYSWALAQPVRRVYFNMTVTGLSVLVALLVGTVQILALLRDALGLRGRTWDWVDGLSFDTIGFVVVGVFAGVWLLAAAVWRFGRIEQRWMPQPAEEPTD